MKRDDMKRYGKNIVLGLAVVGVLVGGFAQPAMAAYSSYFNAATNKLVQHNSSTYSGIIGGSISSNISTADFYIHVLTFSGYGGGYTEYGRSAGTSPGKVYLFHQAVPGGAQSGCFWSIAEVLITGQLTLNCSVNK